jgi:hypothetical protein
MKRRTTSFTLDAALPRGYIHKHLQGTHGKLGGTAAGASSSSSVSSDGAPSMAYGAPAGRHGDIPGTCFNAYFNYLSIRNLTKCEQPGWPWLLQLWRIVCIGWGCVYSSSISSIEQFVSNATVCCYFCVSMHSTSSRAQR